MPERLRRRIGSSLGFHVQDQVLPTTLLFAVKWHTCFLSVRLQRGRLVGLYWLSGDVKPSFPRTLSRNILTSKGASARPCSKKLLPWRHGLMMLPVLLGHRKERPRPLPKNFGLTGKPLASSFQPPILVERKCWLTSCSGVLCDDVPCKSL